MSKLGIASLCVILTLLMSCNLSDHDQEILKKDIGYLENLQFARTSALEKRFFGHGFHAYLKKNVREIASEGPLGQSCHGALICSGGSGTIFISPRFWKIGLPTVIQASMLIHEVRHLEGFTHQECLSPALRKLRTPYGHQLVYGTQECDDSWDGANGAQIIFLGNIERFCLNCTAEDKSNAKKFKDFLLNLMTQPKMRDVLNEDLR